MTRAVLEASRGDNPDKAPDRGLVQDAQGPRLRQVRLQEPRHSLAGERARVLGSPQGVHGQVRRRVPGRRRGSARRRRPPARRRHAPTSRPRCPSCDATRDHRLADRPTDRGRGDRSRARRRLQPHRRRRDLQRQAAVRRAHLPRRHVEEAGREVPQPSRIRHVGRVRECLRQEGIWPTAVHRCIGRPRRIDQPRRLRQGLRRHGRLGLVRARLEPARHRAADPDHRVRQRRPGGGPRDGQHGRRPVQRLQRAAGARARRTARSPTSSTARCACSASWRRMSS